MSGVLDGIRVLDFGRYIAGPYCATLLADMGADVIRVERPVIGSEDRWVSPIASGGEGALFMQMNRNKRCLTLNPKKPEGPRHRAPAGRARRRGGGEPAAADARGDRPRLRDAARRPRRTSSSPRCRRSGTAARTATASASTASRRRCRARCSSRERPRSPAVSTTHGSTSPPRSSPRSAPWRRCSSARRRDAGQQVEGSLLAIGAQHRERHPHRAGGSSRPTAWRR